ncbi:MAG: ABC transporter permease subunit [Candidatus Dormibacteria bacterium]
MRGSVALPVPAAGQPGATDRSLPGTGRPPGGGWRSHLGSLLFLAPGAIWLLLITVYPLIATFRNSVYDASSTGYVGLHNYQEIFSTASILVTFRNNVIWFLVFPFLVTFLGLIFAVLTERIRWSTVFKTVIFMPIIFSATASGLVWRTIFDLDPHIGLVNATTQTVANWISPPGFYPVNAAAGQTVAGLAATGLQAGPSGTLRSSSTLSPGDTARLGFVAVSLDTLKLVGARPATTPTPVQGAITGVAWRDFSPTHPTARGQVLPDEDGLPGLHLTLLRGDGSSAASTTTAANGLFRFDGVGGGSYRVQVDASNFKSGFTGVFFLGTQSLTPTSGLDQTAQAILSVPLVDIAMIIAYLWIWAGFAMVVIAAGLAAMNREVLEAAKIDGASEWQTLRRVTVPMLAPVLVVVLVTMLINVLKLFDIIINMAPGSSQGDANTLALAMYNYGFTGSGDFGLASALAVILFILVVPAMLLNIRRIRG